MCGRFARKFPKRLPASSGGRSPATRRCVIRPAARSSEPWMPSSSSSISSTTDADPIAYNDSSRRAKAPGWGEAWRDALGPAWGWQIGFIAACIFAAAAMRPLADPDLPIHLATGEWIVRHRAVPFVEPWAWTRAGAPFYAYSWAIECVYYLLLTRVDRKSVV